MRMKMADGRTCRGVKQLPRHSLNVPITYLGFGLGELTFPHNII